MALNNPFQLAIKAKALWFDVFDLSTNRKHYPVKYTKLTGLLQEISHGISSDIEDANSFHPANTERRKQNRFDAQTRAITGCNKLLDLLEYSYHANLISSAKFEELSGNVSDIKNMTLAWRSNTA